jgi:hypothetical protein
MTKKHKLQKIYVNSRKAIGLTQTEWATLFNLGVHTGQCNVSLKEVGDRGVNTPEALASQLLVFLSDAGYDTQRIKFDKDFNVIGIPKKAEST